MPLLNPGGIGTVPGTCTRLYELEAATGGKPLFGTVYSVTGRLLAYGSEKWQLACRSQSSWSMFHNLALC
jgi:hypothetical protein